VVTTQYKHRIEDEHRMTNTRTVAQWLHLVQAEYLEMPGLQLTREQVQRLWTLDDHVCDAVLNALVAARFLAVTPKDAYVLAGRSL